MGNKPVFILSTSGKKCEECKYKHREIKILFRHHVEAEIACFVCQLICQHSIFVFLVCRNGKVISLDKPYTKVNDI